MHNIAASLLKARLKEGGLSIMALAVKLWPDMSEHAAELRLHRALNGASKMSLALFCQTAQALGASPARVLAEAEKKLKNCEKNA